MIFTNQSVVFIFWRVELNLTLGSVKWPGSAKIHIEATPWVLACISWTFIARNGRIILKILSLSIMMQRAIYTLNCAIIGMGRMTFPSFSVLSASKIFLERPKNEIIC